MLFTHASRELTPLKIVRERQRGVLRVGAKYQSHRLYTYEWRVIQTQGNKDLMEKNKSKT